MSAGAVPMLTAYAIRYGDKSRAMTLLHNVWETQSLYDSLSDGRRPICSKRCSLQKRMSYIIYAYATQACALCVCARMHECIPLPMQVKLLAGSFFPPSVFVQVMHVCTHVIAFFMIQCVCERVSLCSPSGPPSLMWPRWVWKGNLRSQDPQCCSHLRPLMMGQRVSRANRGRLSLAHTRTRAQWPFIVVSCGSPTSPSAFVGCDSDALLLRRWMDGCHAEVRAVRALLPITHLSPSLLKLLLFPQCNSVFLRSQTTYATFGATDR